MVSQVVHLGFVSCCAVQRIRSTLQTHDGEKFFSLTLVQDSNQFERSKISLPMIVPAPDCLLSELFSLESPTESKPNGRRQHSPSSWVQLGEQADGDLGQVRCCSAGKRGWEFARRLWRGRRRPADRDAQSSALRSGANTPDRRSDTGRPKAVSLLAACRKKMGEQELIRSGVQPGFAQSDIKLHFPPLA